MAKFKYALWCFMAIVLQAAAQSKLPELKNNGVRNTEISRLKSYPAIEFNQKDRPKVSFISGNKSIV
jgi:hypothetical protein